MHNIDYLDIMIQYSCNFSCAGCITMSDYKRSGYVSADEGLGWLDHWKLKINPAVVCLFGGEPTMNPNLYQWIKNVRNTWPSATIKIITNGSLLDKVNLVDYFFNFQPATLQISLHYKETEKRQEIKKKLITQIKTLNKNFKIKEKDPNKPHEQFNFFAENFEIIIAEFGEFIKPYKGYGKHMLPWNSSSIHQSHSKCGSPRNPVLYKNRLYKCGPIANLKDTLTLFNIENKTEWQPYLEYQGNDCNDDLTTFVQQIGKPEEICSMCSASNEGAIAHYAPDAVKVKKGKS